ncbi:unnamed protein product [Diatraea saccharalis]|uniref:Uncharacterized protein n=1 Tax=Diatraea saccharalis TaxID=40085 RepID=A0A9N9RB53_9NEOP|nr:unnamed protein product [Diatraea saccharalis]
MTFAIRNKLKLLWLHLFCIKTSVRSITSSLLLDSEIKSTNMYKLLALFVVIACVIAAEAQLTFTSSWGGKRAAIAGTVSCRNDDAIAAIYKMIQTNVDRQMTFAIRNKLKLLWLHLFCIKTSVRSITSSLLLDSEIKSTNMYKLLALFVVIACVIAAEAQLTFTSSWGGKRAAIAGTVSCRNDDAIAAIYKMIQKCTTRSKGNKTNLITPQKGTTTLPEQDWTLVGRKSGKVTQEETPTAAAQASLKKSKRKEK